MEIDSSEGLRVGAKEVLCEGSLVSLSVGLTVGKSGSLLLGVKLGLSEER